MSGLTTHVLDTAHGRPAAGMAVRLLKGGRQIAEAVTNRDGRCDAPLLADDALEAAFLETVVIDFQVAEGGGHYHVPLLVSPFAYSTYRGS
jgi:5-hydroxyisourate hydrolase